MNTAVERNGLQEASYVHHSKLLKLFT